MSETDAQFSEGDPRMSALAMFQAAMASPDAPDEPGRIAAGLAQAVKDACAASGLAAADITAWGPIVTMIFSDTAAWEAVVVGPDAYQFYPGFIRDDEIVWPNIWVADNYPLEQFIRELTAELSAASSTATARRTRSRGSQ